MKLGTLVLHSTRRLDRFLQRIRHLHYGLSTEKTDLPWVRFRSLPRLSAVCACWRTSQQEEQFSPQRASLPTTPSASQFMPGIWSCSASARRQWPPCLVVAHFCLGVERVQLARCNVLLAGQHLGLRRRRSRARRASTRIMPQPLHAAPQAACPSQVPSAQFPARRAYRHPLVGDSQHCASGKMTATV